MFKKRIIIVVPLFLFIIACVFIFSRANSSAGLGPTSADLPLDPDEPIAFIGHGGMFDLQGNRIEPSPEFLQDAQEYYLNQLSQMATSEQRAQLQSKQTNLSAGADLNARDQMIVNTALIDWLLDELQLHDAGELQGKNNLIRRTIEDLYAGDTQYPMTLDSELGSLLDSQGLHPPSTPDAYAKLASEAYISDCRDAGVPIPPAWWDENAEDPEGDGYWQRTGRLKPEEIFVEVGGKFPLADVYASRSANPKGVCMALPRLSADESEIGLLGVICMGKEAKSYEGRVASNACYWDYHSIPIDTNNFRSRISINDVRFTGGPELAAKVAGKSVEICTDCHTGENPFAIQPDTALDPKYFVGWSDDDKKLFAPETWFRPLVHDSWPQNPGPSNLLDGIPIDAELKGGCLKCHKQPVEGKGAGRFPEITIQHEEYCAAVLQKTIYRNSMNLKDPGPTAYAAHNYALLEACPQEKMGAMADSDIKAISCSSPTDSAMHITVEIINSFDDKAENVTVTGTFENMTLDPASFKLTKSAGVSGPDKPTISSNTFTWKGDIDSKAKITLEYTAPFVKDLPRGSLGTNTVTIEDGYARVVLRKSEFVPEPPPARGLNGLHALPANLDNHVYLPVTQRLAGSCSQSVSPPATPPPTPTSTPSPTPSPTPTSAPPTPLNNGDFESGRTVWSEYSAQGAVLILQDSNVSTSFQARSGSWLAWLGGLPDEISYVEQVIAVPSSASRLTFYGWLASQEVVCGYDTIFVELESASNYGYYYLDMCAENNTNGWYGFWVPLDGFAGDTITLRIGASTDFADNSNFFLDDVAFGYETTAITEHTARLQHTEKTSSRQLAPKATGLNSTEVEAEWEK